MCCKEDYIGAANDRIQGALDRLTTWATEWAVTVKSKTNHTIFTLFTKDQIYLDHFG